MAIKFLLVEHDGILDEFIFKKAVNKGLDLYLVTNNLEDWILKYVRRDNIIITNTDNDTLLFSAVLKFMSQNEIAFAGVGTFFERFVVNTAKLASALKLIHLPIEAALRSSCDKFSMRLACKNANIPQPDFNLVKLNEEEKIKNFLFKHKVSVLKPISGAGSIGVRKLNINSDIGKIKSKILDQINNEDNNYVKSNQELFLIEEYIPGSLFSIDGLVQDNTIYFIGETEFSLGKEPSFVQEGGITPTISYNTDQILKSKDIVSKIVKTLNFNNCGFHCEMRMTESGPFLIEIAARTPGGPILSNYEKANGIDGVSLILDIWLNAKVQVKKIKQKYLIHKDIFAKMNGRVESIEVQNLINQKHEVSDIIIFAKLGDIIDNYILHPKAMYYYSVVGEHINEVQELSKQIEASVKIKIAK